MEITIKFNMPKDEPKYEDAKNGTKYRKVLQAMENYLVSEIPTLEQKPTYAEIKAEFIDLLEAYDVRI